MVVTVIDEVTRTTKPLKGFEIRRFTYSFHRKVMASAAKVSATTTR